MAGYVNIVRAIVCFELPAREASNFCDFWKLTSCDFIECISSLIEVNFFFMCLLSINLSNLCPNMNHFDAVDFSECHSEEVISFFWRSVYFQHLLVILKTYFVSWESEVHYHYSKMFRWEPEGCYFAVQSLYYGNSTLLVHNGALLSSVNAFLVLIRRFYGLIHWRWFETAIFALNHRPQLEYILRTSLQRISVTHRWHYSVMHSLSILPKNP